ncbi:hypothetical protein ALI22I_08040 [Saccharothrix sp. ALI-22-I]|nr:hypothetical protein ALI22I_08040 [Saccharothrix sp. ALI-22-I]
MVGNLATGTVRVDAWWWSWATWAAVVLLVVLAWWFQRATRRPDLAAVVVLADIVTRQWRYEAKVRALDDPDPIATRWRPVTRPELSDDTDGSVSGSSARPEELAAGFRALRRKRLVVLGDAGSGKTTLAVLLVRELVETRADRDPVPVLLPVGSWDLAAHPTLAGWLTDRLAADYPELGGAVADLLADGRVLPVLDGLDEVPADSRADVVHAINASLARSDQLILTCRTAEYAAAGLIADAVAIEPEPLTRATAVEYLSSALTRADRESASWRTLLATVRTADPLAEVCATPLGLWLVRVGYAHADPRPLLDRAALPDAAALRRHLLARVVPEVVAPRERAVPTPFRPRGRYRPDDVLRWLRRLARHLDHDGEPGRDLEWWRLGSDLPPLSFGVYALSAALFGTVFWGVAEALDGTRSLAGLLGVLFGAGLVLQFDGGRPAGSHWTPRKALTGAVQTVQLLSFQVLWIAFFGLAIGLITGVPSALWSLFTTGSLGIDWSVTEVLGVALLLVAGLAIIYAFANDLDIFTDAKTGRTPQDDWRLSRKLSRRQAASGAVAGALLIGVAVAEGDTGLHDVLLLGGMGAAAAGLVLRAVGDGAKPWSAYLAVTVRLGLRRKLPLRPMRFLDDMHRLGLLRAVGPVYQFRHAELQDHLTTSPDSDEGR